MAQASAIPTVALAADVAMPLMGLGTWQLRGRRGYDAISFALAVGYRSPRSRRSPARRPAHSASPLAPAHAAIARRAGRWKGTACRPCGRCSAKRSVLYLSGERGVELA